MADPVDVADETSVSGMVKAVVGAFGRIDVLVNNASLFSSLPSGPSTRSRWQNGGR